MEAALTEPARLLLSNTILITLERKGISANVANKLALEIVNNFDQAINIYISEQIHNQQLAVIQSAITEAQKN